MYGYTMHIPAPPEVYRALHKAVVEVVDEDGGGDGLLLHLAYETDAGCDWLIVAFEVDGEPSEEFAGDRRRRRGHGGLRRAG